MSGKERDLYAILEIGYDDSQERIKQAYHYLAKVYHPDINPRTANLFKEINAAYEILGNPEKRKQYDLEHNIESQRILDRMKVTVSYDPSLAYNIDQHLEEIYKKLSYDNLTTEEMLQIMIEQTGIFNTLAEHLMSDYIKAHQAEDKYQAMPRHEDTSEENEDECPFNWYEEATYYMDADRQPIFEILYNFHEYRFENAIRSIWKRNSFSILGVIFVYLISLFYILRNKVFKKCIPTKKDIKKKRKIKWIKYLKALQLKNKFWQTLFISINLSVFFVLHVIFDLLKVIYWIFDRIIKYFLLPIAVMAKIIIFGMILRFLGMKK